MHCRALTQYVTTTRLVTLQRVAWPRRGVALTASLGQICPKLGEVRRTQRQVSMTGKLRLNVAL